MPTQTDATDCPPKDNGSDSPAPMLTADDVAGILNCSPRTVRRLVDARRIPPPVRLGGLTRWPRAVIDEWIAAGCPTFRRKARR